ncbi:glycosyltransferase family 2 protein [Mycobacterium vicinigordonae]|uniref:Glycosyltransferase n=1 Tax=Mycobacterium vicinigordonae TaxID=1719132 RepID=A0A7D6E9B6_9MYCO|nr:glycosyltransferase family 2 protein [Mycobacterium vicinigordonae]QLL10182.1 glycosyltransferase [Mycobacterium vicinigordonae]
MFSIIVPTYNVASSLHATVESVARQTYSDYELLIVDGGSTDSTVEIAESFRARLAHRLVIQSDPDKGVYDAMNRGVDKSTGAWVYFLGGDDTLYEDATLAKVAAFIDAHQTSNLVYGDVLMRSTSSRYAGRFDLDRLLFEKNICHQSMFYRRELFAGIGPYNLRYPLWADWDFNIRCFSNPALDIQYMDIVVANFNDVSGLSNGRDREMEKRLPLYLKASALELFNRKIAGFKTPKKIGALSKR